MTQEEKDRLDYLIKYLHALSQIRMDGPLYDAQNRVRREIEELLNLKSKACEVGGDL